MSIIIRLAFRRRPERLLDLRYGNAGLYQQVINPIEVAGASGVVDFNHPSGPTNQTLTIIEIHKAQIPPGVYKNPDAVGKVTYSLSASGATIC